MRAIRSDGLALIAGLISFWAHGFRDHQSRRLSRCWRYPLSAQAVNKSRTSGLVSRLVALGDVLDLVPSRHSGAGTIYNLVCIEDEEAQVFWQVRGFEIAG